MQKLITTSWDDGNEADFRIAELLEKYGLKGTFYIPRTNMERQVMSADQVRNLSNSFEIGGHTLNHIRLHTASDGVRHNEINGCRQWLSDVTGMMPQSFCFPGGKFNSQVIAIAKQCGFRYLRTTALQQVNYSKTQSVFPTTLQLYPHGKFTYLRHFIKRQNWLGLVQWLKASTTCNLEKLTEYYLSKVETNGGCFHLWGHSWEIEENQLWQKLEAVFRIISNRQQFSYVENKDILTK